MHSNTLGSWQRTTAILGHVDQYPQLTLDQDSINTLVDTQTTLSRYLSQESTNFDRLIVGQHSANYQLTVDQTSVTVSIEGRPSISLDVHQVLFEMSIKGIN